MSDGPGVFRRLILPVTLLGLTALGFLNTYGDSTGVQKLAAETACGGAMCEVTLREVSKNPIAHKYVYQVGKKANEVTVECQKSAIFLGEYACVKK